MGDLFYLDGECDVYCVVIGSDGEFILFVDFFCLCLGCSKEFFEGLVDYCCCCDGFGGFFKGDYFYSVCFVVCVWLNFFCWVVDWDFEVVEVDVCGVVGWYVVVDW